MKTEMTEEQFDTLHKRSIQLWVEDDAFPPDAETKLKALKRFWPYENFDRANSVFYREDGDVNFYVFDYGTYYIIVCGSYRGNNSFSVSKKEKR